MKVALPTETKHRLTYLALRTGRSPQFIAHHAILDYLEDLENRCLAMDCIAEEELMERYDLEEEE